MAGGDAQGLVFDRAGVGVDEDIDHKGIIRRSLFRGCRDIF